MPTELDPQSIGGMVRYSEPEPQSAIPSFSELTSLLFGRQAEAAPTQMWLPTFREEFLKTYTPILEGEFRQDELNDQGQFVYNLGMGNIDPYQITPEGAQYLRENFSLPPLTSGRPSFIDDLVYEAQAGIADIAKGAGTASEAIVAFSGSPLYPVEAMVPMGLAQSALGALKTISSPLDALGSTIARKTFGEASTPAWSLATNVLATPKLIQKIGIENIQKLIQKLSTKPIRPNAIPNIVPLVKPLMNQRPWEAALDQQFYNDAIEHLGPEISQYVFAPGERKVSEKIVALFKAGMAGDPAAAQQLREAVSEHAHGLAILSKFAQRREEESIRNPLKAIWDTVNKADRARYLAATLSITTHLRNFAQQSVRGGMELLLNAFVDTAVGGYSNAAGSFVDAFLAAKTSKSVLPKLQQTLARFPLLEEKMSVRGSMTDPGGPTFRALEAGMQFFNKTNVFQEQVGRFTVLNATLRHELRRVGLDFDTISPDDVPTNILAKAVHRAQEVTYALPPTGSFERHLLKVLDNAGIRDLVPYSRFNISNAFKEMWAWSPVGPFTPKAWRTLAEGTPDEAARVLGKATIGLEMMAIGSALKADPTGEWYHIRTSDKNGQARLIDMRAYHPFDFILFVGELLNRPPGTPGFRLIAKDFQEAVGFMNRIDATGIQLLDEIRAYASGDTLGEGITRLAGNWLGAWSAAGRTFKYPIEMMNPQEGIQRDKRLNPLTAPFLSNLPGLSQSLPEYQSMFQAAPPVTTGSDAALKLIGASIRRMQPFETEVARLKHLGGSGMRPIELGWTPREGDKTLNYDMKKHLGELSEQIGQMFIETDAYKGGRDVLRRHIMSILGETFKKEIRKIQDVQPETAPIRATKKVERSLSPSLLDLLEEYGFDVQTELQNLREQGVR